VDLFIPHDGMPLVAPLTSSRNRVMLEPLADPRTKKNAAILFKSLHSEQLRILQRLSESKIELVGRNSMKYPYGYRAAALVLALLSNLARPADLPVQTLAVTNSKLGTFEVISHRMEPVGAGAIAGLIGIAVQSGIHSSQDESMRKRLLQSYPEPSCSQLLLEAFSDRLRTSGLFTLESAGKTAAAVDIEIDECGLHLADTTANQFASYVYLKLKVRPANGPAWNESIQVSGRNRYDFEALVNQSGLAKSEVEDALKRAGIRAADKIIYKK
jgi:hypothetical protein